MLPLGRAAANILGLPASSPLVGGRGCLPQNAGWAEPAGGLVGERELGVRDGTWRTLSVSSGAAWGLQGWAPGARPLKCLVPCGHLARTGSGLLHWVSCPSPPSASGTSCLDVRTGKPGSMGLCSDCAPTRSVALNRLLNLSVPRSLPLCVGVLRGSTSRGCCKAKVSV